MKAKWATCLILGSLCAMPIASYAADDDAGTMNKHETAKEHVEDGWITTKIKAEYAKDKLVSATRIHVNTDKGVVMLSGHAKSKAEMDRAVTLAKNTKGVTDVKNDIQVGGTGATSDTGASGSTSYGR